MPRTRLLEHFRQQQASLMRGIPGAGHAQSQHMSRNQSTAANQSASGEPLQTISGEIVFPSPGRGGFGPYGTGMFQQIYVTLRLGSGKVRGIRNLLNRQRVAEITRFRERAEDSEYHQCFAFCHAVLRD
jgi:hypothetical protein